MQVFANRYLDLAAGLVPMAPAPIRFITGQVFPELHQMIEQQAVELWQMADAARQSPDAEARAQTRNLETVAAEHAAPAMWEAVL